jgi:hypothetical protein
MLTLATLLIFAAPALTLECPPNTAPRVKGDEGVKTQWCEAKGGVRQGPWVRRHANGKVAAQMVYAAGRRHGLYEAWYPTGRPKAKGRYEQGARMGPWQFWDAGGWQRAGTMDADQAEGLWKVLNDQGETLASGGYLKGARDGAWTWFLPGGVQETGTYSGGKLTDCKGSCPMLQPQFEIEEAFRLTQGARRACYRTAKKAQPELALEFEMAWTVDADGRAKDIQLSKGAPPPGALRDCIGATVTTLRLPSPPQPIPTKRVVKFRPKSQFTDALQTEGHCHTKTLRPVLNPGRPALLKCVKRAQAWPRAEPGQVVLTWPIAADGSVGVVGVTPEDNIHLVHCLETQVKSWRFEPGKGCQVEYTVKWD